jgi:hypothetical protein
MTTLKTLLLFVPMLAIVGCGEAQEVAVNTTSFALNERLFTLPSMEPLSGACMVYGPGASERGSGTVGGGAVGGGDLSVSHRLEDDVVVVEFRHDDVILQTQRYDEAFFRSGAVDEFDVAWATGNGLHARYWGALERNGVAGCAPFDNSGP